MTFVLTAAQPWDSEYVRKTIRKKIPEATFERLDRLHLLVEVPDDRADELTDLVTETWDWLDCMLRGEA